MKTPVSYLLLLSLSIALLSPIQVSRAEESASAPPSESQASVLVEQDHSSDSPATESSSGSTTGASKKSESESVKTPTQEPVEPLKPLITQTPGVKAGLTPVANAAELKTALEDGESVQLTADITLNTIQRIQIGKANPQNVTIDGADPLTGQPHFLKIEDPSSINAATALYLEGTGMKGKTITFTNLQLTNNNYYGICHYYGDTNSDTTTLAFHNVTYAGSAQALHLMRGTIAFSGTNQFVQSTGLYSQEFAEAARLEFNGGQTTISHNGSAGFLSANYANSNSDGRSGIFVSNGAKVILSTNQSIIGATSLSSQDVAIDVTGTGASLTLNSTGPIFRYSGNNSSPTTVTNGASLIVPQATNYTTSGSKNQGITATNGSTVNMALSGSLYSASQTNSPIKADQNSTIKIHTANDTFVGNTKDSQLSATQNSTLDLQSDKDFYSSLYSPTDTTIPIINVDSTSQAKFNITNNFISAAQDSPIITKIAGKLDATFGQFYASTIARVLQYHFLEDSQVTYTINGAQTGSKGLLPLSKAGSEMLIADKSTVVFNNQTTTALPMIQGVSSTVTAPLSIGDANVTFNNNDTGKIFLNMQVNLKSTSPHTIYRGIQLTEKDQTKTVYPFAHFEWRAGTTPTATSTDLALETKLKALGDSTAVKTLLLQAPLPPEIINLTNDTGLPNDDDPHFNFKFAGQATPSSELTLNFLSAAGQSLLKGPAKTAAANQTFDYQFESDLPTQPNQIAVEANYPAPYTLTTPVRKVLKDIPAGKLGFLAAPTHLDFGSLPLTNSQSPLYPYTKTADTSLIVSDPRATNRGDWAVQVNLKQPFTAGQATLDNALIWRKDQTTKPLVAGQPQQLYLKAAHAPIQPGADETDLTDLLQETVQAQFPAGPKQTTTPYTAELELMLITAPN